MYFLTLPVFVDLKGIMAYVELLKEIIFDENFTVVKFYKKIDFPFVQKTKAEEVLYKALETIASENNVKARKLLVNFNELINSTSVKTYWNGVYIRDERNKTQCIKNILKEKEDQEACQIKSNVLDEHIIESNLLLKRKRSFEKLDSEPLRSPKNKALDDNNDKKKLVPSIGHAESISFTYESDSDYPWEQNDGLNSGISSVYEGEDEENSSQDSSDEDDEDTVELADVSFSSFIGSKTNSKNYNWKLNDNESVRDRLIIMTKRAIEEMKQSEKVDSKIMSIIWLGLSSIIDLSSEFKGGMHSWFNDDWIPLKTKALSKINVTVEEFSGEILEFITKVENFCTSHDCLGARKLLLEKMIDRPTDTKFRQILKVYFYVLDLFLENPYLFVRKNGKPQKHTEIQYVIKMVDPILEIIFSDCQSLVRLMWGETVSQVTNNSKRKIDLCIRTEDGTKELSHSECAQKATMMKILKDRSKSFRTNKCILNKYLKNDLPSEALENTTIFGLQLAALEGQLIGVDLLDEGLYFGFDGPAFEFPAQICSIDVLRQTLEVLYYFKVQVIRKAKFLSQNSRKNSIAKLLYSEDIMKPNHYKINYIRETYFTPKKQSLASESSNLYTKFKNK
ncbi:hypothetical protein Glove_590g3 [Diversispora epigaea]|uniref:Uncharacterized protein n=1 Tax=Diversispora epigaea TaxID=1348612 RepID=A0A397G7Z7_9GLOM|nr:hypothetical protein Glove_590g3 [Diversispora epigaea]